VSKTKLKPCPWCGNAADLTLMSLSGVRVTCDCCAAEGPVRKSATAAKKAWNERDGQSLNDQLWCLIEIRKLIGDKTGKLMQSEVVERVRELVVKRDVQEYIERKRRESAKGDGEC
jgi:Lar family restriction alleviation protein